jgi:putative serine protease PepD
VGKRSSTGRTQPLVVWGVVIALVAGGIGGGIAAWIDAGVRGSVPTPKASSGSATSKSCDAVQVADRVLPSVVTISLKTASGSGVGAGEIIRSSGYILTNNHVIADAASGGSLSVLYSSGTTVAAKLIGRDPKHDLAVIKVSSSSALPTIAIANSSTVQVGEPVVALGAPLGLSSSVSAGIVSALGRDVPVPSDNGTTATLTGAIQTDASINPGNSGGALVNCDGQLIGINTAIATVPNSTGASGGGSVGIGFAIPSTFALGEADKLIAGGEVVAPYFGASVAPIPESVAAKFSITDGLYIDAIDAAGPAASAGLRVGDVITMLDGAPATSGESLVVAVSRHSVGDTVSVKYVRGGTTSTASVKLTAGP